MQQSHSRYDDFQLLLPPFVEGFQFLLDGFLFGGEGLEALPAIAAHEGFPLQKLHLPLDLTDASRGSLDGRRDRVEADGNPGAGR